MIVRFLRFLLVVGLGFFLLRWLWKGSAGWPFSSKKKQRDETHPGSPNSPGSSPQVIAEMKKDPVCGTYVPENQAVIYQLRDQTHYFCSEECRQKFQEADANG